MGWLLQPVGRYSRRRLLATLAALFALCHAGYYLAGIRFDAYMIAYGPSNVDPELLRHRLAQSIFYLHSQPPLYNLFTGLILKLFPGREVLAFTIAYVSLGLVLYLALFALLRRLGVSRGLSLALSTWFMASPAFVLYEHWVMYTFTGAVLLTVSALAFHQVMLKPTRLRGFGLFALLGLLGALQALFHLIHYLGAAVTVLLFSPRRRRPLLLPALLPLLLLLGLYTKNLVLFGKFASSTWFGMNFAAVTVRALSEEERRTLVAEGKLSPVALVPRFADLVRYPPQYRHLSGFAGVSVLRQVHKSTGAKNCNHLAYVALSDAYLKDDRYIVLHRPRTFLVGLLNAWLCYFRSASDYPYFSPANRARAAPMILLYDHLFYGKIPGYRLRLGGIRLYFAPASEPRLNLFLVLGLPLVFGYGLRLAARRDSPLSRDQRLLVLYACANIVYVALVGNLVEVGENHRFRFTTDPLSVVLLGVLMQYGLWPRLLRFRPGRRARAAAAAAPVLTPERPLPERVVVKGNDDA
jgi:hypothetical protein